MVIKTPHTHLYMCQTHRQIWRFNIFTFSQRENNQVLHYTNRKNYHKKYIFMLNILVKVVRLMCCSGRTDLQVTLHIERSFRIFYQLMLLIFVMYWFSAMMMLSLIGGEMIVCDVSISITEQWVRWTPLTPLLEDPLLNMRNNSIINHQQIY